MRTVNCDVSVSDVTFHMVMRNPLAPGGPLRLASDLVVSLSATIADIDSDRGVRTARAGHE